MKQIIVLIIFVSLFLAGCEKRVFEDANKGSANQTKSIETTTGKSIDVNKSTTNQTKSIETTTGKSIDVNKSTTNQTKTVKPDVPKYVDAVVKAESGAMYVYLEHNADFLKLYPKMTGSFNMWELDYYLDCEVNHLLYKKIKILVDPNDGGKSAGDLCYTLKQGSLIQINKDAWDKYISGKSKYIMPVNIRFKQ